MQLQYGEKVRSFAKPEMAVQPLWGNYHNLSHKLRAARPGMNLQALKGLKAKET